MEGKREAFHLIAESAPRCAGLIIAVGSGMPCLRSICMLAVS
jgi:hypothetical protein